MNLSALKAAFARVGVIRLYAKFLAENDNSKNQVYFGPDFQALNILPVETLEADNSGRTAIFKGRLRFGWLDNHGAVVPAPGAQLILYPQYPEVRFSGFLRGCRTAPNQLMAGRLKGRILFLGITADRRVIGHVVGAESEVAGEMADNIHSPTQGVFLELTLPTQPSQTDSRARLLLELGRIHRLSWIDSKQLDAAGQLKPCNAPQCGGYTLEAELGIAKNGDSEPDFLGWEVKQHSVGNFRGSSLGAAITLMTPEPTGGFYKEQGVEAFIRRFGYADKNGREDRFNFGGIHRAGQRHPSTGLTMKLEGFDAARGRITNAAGSIALISDSGTVAAEWAFSGLLEHWSRKHMRAVYVPAMSRTSPIRQYAYGDRVRLGVATDSLRLLSALAKGAVYYDPGIKLENASTRPTTKRRSQFRIASKSIGELYHSIETVTV